MNVAKRTTNERMWNGIAGYEFADHISDFKKFMALATYFARSNNDDDGSSSNVFISLLPNNIPLHPFNINDRLVARTMNGTAIHIGCCTLGQCAQCVDGESAMRTKRYFCQPENVINNKMDLRRMTLCIL